MSEQLKYGIKQALIMGVLAVLGYVVAHQTDFFGSFDPSVAAFAAAVLPVAVRVFEGLRDGQRASAGKLQAADVQTTINATPAKAYSFANDPNLKVNQELAETDANDWGY